MKNTISTWLRLAVLLPAMYYHRPVQGQDFEWQKLLESTASSADELRVNDVDADAMSNSYIIGNFKGTLNGTASNSGSSDVFIAKYNTSGALQWIVTIGGPGEDEGNGISVDNSGNVYMALTVNTGGGSGSVSFHSVTSPTATTASTGKTAVLGRYSASGNHTWHQLIESSTMSEATDVTLEVPSSDNPTRVYISGNALGSGIDFCPSGCNISTNCSTYTTGFIGCYTTAGIYSWAQLIELDALCSGSAGHYVNQKGIAATGSNVFIIGEFRGSYWPKNVSSALTGLSLGSTSGDHGYVARLSPATGQCTWISEIWAFSGGIFTNLSVPGGITLDLNSSPIAPVICGDFYGDQVSLRDLATNNQYAYGTPTGPMYYSFMAKMNPGTGAVTSALIHAGAASRIVTRSISSHYGTGNIYLTGECPDNTGFYTSGYSSPATTISASAGAGDHDIYLAKYDDTYNLLWAENLMDHCTDNTPAATAVRASKNSTLDVAFFTGNISDPVIFDFHNPPHEQILHPTTAMSGYLAKRSYDYTCLPISPLPVSVNRTSPTDANVNYLLPAGTYQLAYRMNLSSYPTTCLNSTIPVNWNTTIFTSTGAPGAVSVTGLVPGVVYQWYIQDLCGIPGDYRSYKIMTPSLLGKTDINPATASTSAATARIYPSPANGSVTVELPAIPEGPVVLSVCDMLGNEVKRVTGTGKVTTMEIGDLSAGFYLVKSNPAGSQPVLLGTVVKTGN